MDEWAPAAKPAFLPGNPDLLIMVGPLPSSAPAAVNQGNAVIGGADIGTPDGLPFSGPRYRTTAAG